jgi:hypothetical protein
LGPSASNIATQAKRVRRMAWSKAEPRVVVVQRLGWADASACGNAGLDL